MKQPKLKAGPVKTHPASKRYKPGEPYPARGDVVIVKLIWDELPRWCTFTMPDVWCVGYPDSFDSSIQWWMPSHKAEPVGDNRLQPADLKEYGLAEEFKGKKWPKK